MSADPTSGRGLTPIQTSYYEHLISDSDSPTLMAAVYWAVTDDLIPRCRWWWKRHDWKRGGEMGKVVGMVATGRTFSCRRCGEAFSVGSFGYKRWSVKAPAKEQDRQ